MTRSAVDFSIVPEHQMPMHDRLLNWGRWAHGSGHAQMSPMFRMYRSSEVFADGLVSGGASVDIPDAALIAKGVVALPEDNRHALSWYYVNTGSPHRACRVIGCGMEHLARLVVDGRTMLVNRKI
jgi:hypothetical protein